MEATLQNLRRKNLKEWLVSNGGVHVACSAVGLPKSSESHISQILSGSTFGGKAARNLELKLGIVVNSLDDDDCDLVQGAQVTPRLSPQAIELALLFDLLTDRAQRAKVYGGASALILAAL